MKLKPYITFEILKEIWGIGVLYMPKKHAFHGSLAFSVHILCFAVGIGQWRDEWSKKCHVGGADNADPD